MIVASFYAPREEKWPGTSYDDLLVALDASCRRVGVRHMVISDSPRPVDTFHCKLPDNLMAATLEGQRQFLACVQEPVLFVGADCLLTRDPSPMFLGDMTITTGPFSDCPMNTGAIWCANGAVCEPVWRAALALSPVEWGDDQTSLYAAVQSSGLAVTELRCEDHNWAPDSPFDDAGMPTVVHFRGRRKTWMIAWARRFLAHDA